MYSNVSTAEYVTATEYITYETIGYIASFAVTVDILALHVNNG